MYDISQRTIRIIAEITGIRPQLIELHHTWGKDLQSDSLACVELALALEEDFGISIDQDEFDKLQTVQQIIDYVAGVCTEPAVLPVFNPRLSIDALIMAEEFMRRFEGDAAQEGIDAMLAQLRTAITEERLRTHKVAVLLKCSMENILALDDAKNIAYAHDGRKHIDTRDIIRRGHNACAALGYPYVAGESTEDEIEQARRLAGSSSEVQMEGAS